MMKLVLGIGNEILTDDGIGPKLVNDLSKDCPDQNVHFECASVGGLEIIELLGGYDEAVLIDAIRTKDGIPGSVYLFSPDDFKETTHLSNLHDISFLTALRLGKELNIQLPDKIRIIAIEIIEDLELSDELTPPLNSCYPQILKEIRDYLIAERVMIPG